MQQLLEFIRGIDPILLSAFGFLVGTLFGNWIAIGRDRRLEFNAAAKPLRAQLISARDNPTPFHKIPNDVEIDFMQHYMWPLRRRKFRAAIERYKQRHHEQMRQDEIGAVSYADAALISACADDILTHWTLR